MPRTTLLILLLLAAGSRSTDGPVPSGPATNVRRNVTLVEVRDGSTRESVTLVLEDGRIASLADPAPGSVPPGATLLDWAGRWALPGQIDVHVHDSSEAHRRDRLAWGVTAVQLMPNAPPQAPGELALRCEMAEETTPRLQLASPSVNREGD